MARVAHRLVVEVVDLAVEGLAQRAKAARGVERLVGHAIERERLDLLQRQRFAHAPVDDRLARIAVFVDEAVGAPRQVVLERVGGIDRQRAHAHLHVAQRVERPRHRVRDDRDEPGRQPALRNQRRPRIHRERLHPPRALHVLGEVEIVRARRHRGRGDQWRQVERARTDDECVAADQVAQRGGIIEIAAHGGRTQRRHRREARGVLVGDRQRVVAGGLQEMGDRLADLAGAKQDESGHGGALTGSVVEMSASILGPEWRRP